ncbi:inositol monophosphatase family protein, partial [uncultured Polaribacter sp.]|uniref:inositol monophosphatase family protein n=1 Tax=uncultured Polaribacter sp. TaxID=174711 RepID=UPI00259B9643
TDKTLSNTPNKNLIKNLLDKKVKELGLQSYQEISGAGSVLNAVLVVENTPAILIKLPKKEQGGGSIWDFAATACIFKELGLIATDFEGRKLDLNKKGITFMNDKGVLFTSLPQ